MALSSAGGIWKDSQEKKTAVRGPKTTGTLSGSQTQGPKTQHKDQHHWANSPQAQSPQQLQAAPSQAVGRHRAKKGVRKNIRQTLSFSRGDRVILRFQSLSRKKGEKGRKCLLHLRTFGASGYLNQNKSKKQTHTEQTHL